MAGPARGKEIMRSLKHYITCQFFRMSERMISFVVRPSTRRRAT
jgi:hypothetical protein